MGTIHDRYFQGTLYSDITCSLQGMPNNCSAGVVSCIYPRGGRTNPRDVAAAWTQPNQYSLEPEPIKSVDQYIQTYASKNVLYRLPLHFAFVRILEGMWQKTMSGAIPTWTTSGVPFHAGELHNIWMWLMSDQDHEWDCMNDCHDYNMQGRNTTSPNICAFINWLRRQPTHLVGRINVGKWTRSTHKHGRVRGAMYMPSDYVQQFLDGEIAKLQDHVDTLATLFPVRGTILEDDPICNLWRN